MSFKLIGDVSEIQISAEYNIVLDFRVKHCEFFVIQFGILFRVFLRQSNYLFHIDRSDYLRTRACVNYFAIFYYSLGPSELNQDTGILVTDVELG